MPELEPGQKANKLSLYQTAIIPQGFTVSNIDGEKNVETGLVIYDIPDGAIVNWENKTIIMPGKIDEEEIKTKVNQFVWIPVKVESTDFETNVASFKRSVWENNSRVENNIQSANSFPNNSTQWDDYAEQCSFDETTGIKKQISMLTKSIYYYKGFWIGRYEAGVKPKDDGTETPRTNTSKQTDEFVIQQDKYPYNFIKWGINMQNTTEGAVNLCNNLYKESDINYGGISMLCTGAAWDSMLDFIKDTNNVTNSIDWGNYNNSGLYNIKRGSMYFSSTWTSINSTKGTAMPTNTSILLTTGSAEDRNVSKNIYDISGNCYEWTTESYKSEYRICRGGYYGYDGTKYPASDCSEGDPSQRKSKCFV